MGKNLSFILTWFNDVKRSFRPRFSRILFFVSRVIQHRALGELKKILEREER